MGKIYCLKCNKATEFSISKPAFCSHCGKAYIESTASSTPATPSKPVFTTSITPTRQRRVESEYPDDDDETRDAQTVPIIDKIEFQLTQKNLRPNTQNGREVFDEGRPSDAAEVLNKKAPAKVSKAKQRQLKEDFKQDFKRQLTSRKNDSSEIQ